MIYTQFYNYIVWTHKILPDAPSIAVNVQSIPPKMQSVPIRWKD